MALSVLHLRLNVLGFYEQCKTPSIVQKKIEPQFDYLKPGFVLPFLGEVFEEPK